MTHDDIAAAGLLPWEVCVVEAAMRSDNVAARAMINRAMAAREQVVRFLELAQYALETAEADDMAGAQ